ncbi:MAG: hypothetical protein CTY22_00530 [Methylomonas sp.]|nr:MAG: hypothetical protein CTY23_01650 [Methylomonas sp.]PPD27922.1 MAG: hypothetical protein CTY22_00530 [Methylomonas sp.]PPD40032.1 MAG: hypothetical protein CTY21_00530 [Methylomonas sp.]PPD41580.1 MAG: hypothetical protein CTY17_03620 [Methylomonas sp.]PPD51973.1 MAG: hypothetical protein CTY11_10155 [Methylomonas sp.]
MTSVYTLVVPLRIGEDYYAVNLTVKGSAVGYKLYNHQALKMAKPDGIYGRVTPAANDDAEGLRLRPA